MKSVAIICPFHNDSKWLPRFVDSVLGQVYPITIVLFVDNASRPEEFEAMLNETARLLPIGYVTQTGGDYGFCHACNIGAQGNDVDYFYFVNPDCWLEPYCIFELVRVAEQNPNALLFSRLCDYDSGERQCEIWRGFDMFGNSCHGLTGPVFSQSGFSFISRKWFNRIGGFDAAGYMYGEEEDLSWRTWIAGGEVKEVGISTVHAVHHRNHNSEYHVTANSRFLINRNCLFRILKNCQHILLLLLIPCVALMFLEGLVVFILYGPRAAWTTAIKPLISIWQLRGQIRAKRAMLKEIRQRSDWWMLRWFRPWRFGRWDEVRKVLKLGIPESL